MDKYDELRSVLSDTADEMVQVAPFPADWAPYLVHILKFLDHTAQRGGDEIEFNGMLEALRDILQARIDNGSWENIAL